MTSICLSLIPILRCQALSSLESGVLLIPPALEIIFCVGLFIVKPPSSGKHSLLASEGFVYFALALLDLLSHLLTAVRDSINAFKVLDIVIGSASCIPLSLYTVYLITLANAELLPPLPQRLHRIVKYTLYFCVPLIVLFNALGSFVGLTYRMFHEHLPYNTIAVRFTNGTVTAFFNAMALVLLTLFQALNFFACFYRLIKAMINQRRIESTAGGNDNEVHLFNGLPWIAAGLKLGAIETVVGFAAGGFGEALTRRILRFLGRATLIIGTMKGVDTIEDFRIFGQRDVQARRGSALRALISNPRNSTFLHLGGHGHDHGFVHGSQGLRRTSSVHVIDLGMAADEKRATTISKPLPTFSPGPYSAVSPQREQRVTVRFQRNTQPVLEMKRISDLDIPSPLVYPSEKGSTCSLEEEENEKFSPPQFTPFLLRPLTASFSSTRSSLILGRRARHTIGDLAIAKSARQSSMVLPRQTMMSRLSNTSDTLEEVQVLSKRFSALPPRITNKLQAQQAVQEKPIRETVDEEIFLARSASQRTADSASTQDHGGLVRRGSSVRRKPVPRDSAVEREYNLRVPSTIVSHRTSIEVPPGITTPPHSAVRQTLSVTNHSDETHHSSNAPSSYRHTIAANVSSSTHRDSHLEFPPNSERTSDVFRDGHAALDDAWRSVGLTRIKSIGYAPQRRTPTPNHSLMSRESVSAEWDQISESLHEVVVEAASPGPSVTSTIYQPSTARTISSFGT